MQLAGLFLSDAKLGHASIMITFFTTAKSFTGEAFQRQVNAIRSWQRVHPDVEVFLFGRGEGYVNAVREFGMRWFPEVACSPSGCPRIDSMFALTEQHAQNRLKAYVNCDIMLGPDLVPGIQNIKRDRFLLVSQRWNVDWKRVIDFSSSDNSWDKLEAEARRNGRLMTSSGIDMFLYCGDFWRELPELVVGRAGYDNYLIFYCRLHNIPVVDGTDLITLIHQDHDYAHLKGGIEEVFQGEEARENIRQAGGLQRLFSIRDADYRLTRQGLKRNRHFRDWREYCEHVRILNQCAGRTSRSLREWCEECIGEWRIRRTWKPGGRSVRDYARFSAWALLRLCGKR